MRPASFARFAPRSPSRFRTTSHAPRFQAKTKTAQVHTLPNQETTVETHTSTEDPKAA
ncbi:TPA: hypothetical protein ACX6SC_002741 [Photobacterium damselae]